MKKLLLSFFCMLVTTMALAYDVEVDGIYYDLNTEKMTATVVAGDKRYEGDIVIPEIINASGSEYSVTVIDSWCFGYTDITSILIPTSIKKIRNLAFYQCKKLTKLYIPSSVTEIENESFRQCENVREVKVSNGNPNYDSRDNCNAIVETRTNTIIFGCITSTIPASVHSIASYAFAGLSALIDLSIPACLTNIAHWAFAKCPNIATITVDENNPVYDSRDNCNAIIKKENNVLIKGCNNTVIPPSVERIEATAFADCNEMLSMPIPETVTRIGVYAFANCRKLTSITIPSSLTILEDRTFAWCDIKSYTLPASVTQIGCGAFEGANYSYLTCLSNNPPYLPYGINRGNNATLFVPANLVDTYKQTDNWKDFANILPIGGEEYYASFDNALYVEKAAARTNREATLSLKMKNNVPITSFQCDIVMPEGVSIAMEDDEFYMIDLSTERTTAQKTNTFDSALQTDGSVRVLCSSTRNYTFAGNDGEVATIKVNVADDVKGGDYFVLLKNVVMSDANGNTYKSDYVASVLTLSEYDLGDANNDFNVNIADYTTIANHILGRECEQYVAKAADVNCDNEVNVGDLSGLANLILYGTVTAPEVQTVNAAKSMFKVSTELDDQIYADATYINAGETKSLPVLMKNSVAMTGFQFDIDMPTGFAIAMNDEFYDISLSTKRTTARKTNTFDSALQTDGTVRVLCGSTNSYAFSGNDGEVALVTIKASDNVEPGDYTITLKNIVMSDEAGKAHKVADSKVTLTVASETTGISSASASKEMSDGKYVINNRLVIKNGNRTYNAHGELIR